MQEILSKLSDGIQQTLPPGTVFQVVPESRLADMPKWDSLHSVTLHIFLEETFKVKIPFELFEGDSTIGEIVTFIVESGS